MTLRSLGILALVAAQLPLTTAAAWSQSGMQRPRRGVRSNPEAPAAGMPTPTLEGTLKMMTNKEITIQLQSEQLLVVRRDRKTKFLDKDKEIKPSDIAVGTPLAIDVREDLDLKPIAVRVIANPPPPKSGQKSEQK
jgi:hypothetical protein